jgi:hypothetical protein
MERAEDIWHPTVSVLPKRTLLSPTPPLVTPPPRYSEEFKDKDLTSTASSGHSHSSRPLLNGDIELEKTNGSHNPIEWPDVGKVPGVYNDRHNAAMILIFLKWFDVDSQKIRGIRPIYVNRHDKTGKLTPIIADMMEWKQEQGEQPVNIAFFEEIKPGMIEPLKPSCTFVQSEIQDGDIICFMRAQPAKRYILVWVGLMVDWMNCLRRESILIRFDIMNFFIIRFLSRCCLDIPIRWSRRNFRSFLPRIGNTNRYSALRGWR